MTRYATLEAEAAATRDKAADMLREAERLDVIADFGSSDAGNIITGLLQQDVNLWEKLDSWRPLDDAAKTRQGGAARSKQLLEYFHSAGETAKALRAEAARLIELLERAADQGRIQRT